MEEKKKSIASQNGHKVTRRIGQRPFRALSEKYFKKVYTEDINQ